MGTAAPCLEILEVLKSNRITKPCPWLIIPSQSKSNSFFFSKSNSWYTVSDLWLHWISVSELNYCHLLYLHVSAQDFPVPHLILLISFIPLLIFIKQCKIRFHVSSTCFPSPPGSHRPCTHFLFHSNCLTQSLWLKLSNYLRNTCYVVRTK